MGVETAVLGAQAASSLMQAGAARESGQYQAQVAKNNSIIANRNAIYAQQQGAIQAENIQRKTSETIAAQRAIAAANGIDVNSGSALNAQTDAALIGKENLSAQVQSTAQAVTNYRNQSAQFQSDAGYDAFAGNMSAVGSIIGGASSIGAKYAAFQSGYRSPLAGGA